MLLGGGIDTDLADWTDRVPKPGVKYFDTAEWNYVMKGARKQFKKIKQMLGGGKSRKGKKSAEKQGRAQRGYMGAPQVCGALIFGTR